MTREMTDVSGWFAAYDEADAVREGMNWAAAEPNMRAAVIGVPYPVGRSGGGKRHHGGERFKGTYVVPIHAIVKVDL